uniref:Uncharacterized protein n=1 Tax=Alexandrium catenella TaxID=2925 RepID=A0A7S1RVQ8_ALECA
MEPAAFTAPATAHARAARAALGPRAQGRSEALRQSAVLQHAGRPAAAPTTCGAGVGIAVALAALGSWLPGRRACPSHGRRRRLAAVLRRGGEGEGASTKVGAAASAAGWGYVLLGVAFAASLVVTLGQHPLFPFKPSSAAWSFAWLLQTIWDYYATALCLCGVIVATEGWATGGLWSLGILLLGSSFSCFYVATRLLRRGTIALRSGPAV